MISIAIPTYQNPEGIKSLLESIAQSDLPFPYEVLVIANPPNAATRSECLKYAQVRYLETNEIGVNRARNIGLIEARYPLLLYFDDDCIVEDFHLIKKHLEFHEANPDVLAYGGLYHLQKAPATLSKIYQFLQMSWLHSGVIGQGSHSKHLIGGHFSIKKNLLGSEEFDPQIIYGGSEHEFFLRLSQQNKKLILGSLSILHASQISFRAFLRKAQKQGAGKAYIDKKGYVDQTSLYYYSERTYFNSNLNSFNLFEHLLLKIYQAVFNYHYRKNQKKNLLR